MRSRAEIVAELVSKVIIAVIRCKKAEHVLPLCDALVTGGLSALEITLTTPEALSLIGQARSRYESNVLVGAGSVLNTASAQEALKAGAEFIVSPICKTSLVQTVHWENRPVMLGAYTPTEAQTAHEAGADFIKIFPADGLGPAYIKALLAPMPHLRIVPTGGVDLVTGPRFLQAGCAALGVGSALLDTKLIETGDWSGLSQRAKAYADLSKTTP